MTAKVKAIDGGGADQAASPNEVPQSASPTSSVDVGSPDPPDVDGSGIGASMRFGKASSPRTSAAAARREWKKAAHLVLTESAARTALAKVTLENKIGTKAEDLADGKGGFWKVLGLAVQRALRDFGKAGVGPEEGKTPRTPDELKFDAEEEGGSSKYAVRQPAFVCRRIEDGEFAKVRAAFGVSERQYHAVFGLQDGRRESDFYVIGSADAAGKSSSFFFLSPDQQYILKSCTSTDVKTLVGMVGRYREYVESQRLPSENGKRKKPSSTLLPRYLGMYSLEFEDPAIPPVVMVAMTNFFGGALKIHLKYDLKGSTHGRAASEKERSKKSPVFKDLDWMEEGRRLRFPAWADMERVRSQLERDTSFLSAELLIDYSLLVGLHNMDDSEAEAWRYDNSMEAVRVVKARSEKDMTIAYYGIVDVLTPYGIRKMGETLLTGTVMCCRDVSCQPPETYRRRFMDFCTSEVLACDEGDQKDGEKSTQLGEIERSFAWDLVEKCCCHP